MLRLAILLVAAAALWGGWWFWGRGSEADAIAGWFAARDGSSVAAVSTQGFPNRYDTQLSQVEIRAGPVTWTIPRLSLNRLVYEPGHYVIVFGGQQGFALPTQTLRLSTGEAKASAVYDGAALERTAFAIETPVLTSDAGWQITAHRLLFATRRADNRIEVALAAQSFGDSGGVTDLRIEGAVTLQDGVPTGILTVTATDPDQLARLTAARGLPAARPPYELRLEDGQIWLGAERIGRAPILP